MDEAGSEQCFYSDCIPVRYVAGRMLGNTHGLPTVTICTVANGRRSLLGFGRGPQPEGHQGTYLDLDWPNSFASDPCQSDGPCTQG